MIPGFNEQLMPKGMEKESQARIKRFMTMMDSMTDEGESVLKRAYSDASEFSDRQPGVRLFLSPRAARAKIGSDVEAESNASRTPR